MKKTNKILAIVLAIIMMMFTIPITASAVSSTSGTCGENLTWTYDATTYAVTISGTGKMYDYWWNETPFGNAGDIKKVVIENGVTSIGEYAFYGCVALVSIDIPESVTSINEYAFSMCHNLESIKVDSNNKYFSSDEYDVLFNKDKTTLIKYPNGNARKSYTLPESVTTISIGAFEDSYRLSEVRYPGTEDQWNTIVIKESNESIKEMIKVFGNDDPYKYPVIDSGVCGDNLTWSYNSKTRVLTISGSGDMYDYTYDKWDDSGNQPWTYSFREIVIEDGVTSIGKNAFAGWKSIVVIDLPNTLTTIGDSAFYGCNNLKDVVIPNSVTSIGKNAFEECTSLVEVIIGRGITEIKSKAFYGCSELRMITLPVGLISYNSSAFTLCENLKDVYYGGTKTQWKAVKISGMGLNDQLSKVNRIHYNYCEHMYDGITTLPTCTEQGYTTYTCECGNSYVGDYLDASGHSYTSEITTPATHTETGVMTYTCDCGDTYTEVIAKLEKHNYEAVVTAPTCTEQGYTTYTCECSDSYVADYVNATGHTEETIPAVAPTCTETGLTEGAKCSICGETLTEQKELPANGHSPANAVEENYIAPDCTENGSKDVVVYCSVCDEEISRETVTLDATGHSYTTAVTAPTCTEQGYTTYTCSCGDNYVDDYVNATGHADNDGDGYCDACNEQLEDNNSQISIISLIMRIINFLLKLIGIK